MTHVHAARVWKHYLHALNISASCWFVNLICSFFNEVSDSHKWDLPRAREILAETGWTMSVWEIAPTIPHQINNQGSIKSASGKLQRAGTELCFGISVWFKCKKTGCYIAGRSGSMRWERREDFVQKRRRVKMIVQSQNLQGHTDTHRCTYSWIIL